ncbi:uncharacterized protein LOC107368746 [Tetranychus urticae]|uniref:Cyanate lyase C-terminal domain-containing protein n=1 Tax=Tetranychus urticae TaxID=32264 RepID=T1KZQ3_TETUR|nr:uncharacterized protein LOC107368746 [Tetranychus urticae]
MRIYSRLFQISSANYARQIMSNQFIKAKESKGLTYQQMAQLLSVNKVWLTSVLHGQNCCDIQLAHRICDTLGISHEYANELTSIPLRGNQNIINDPLIYRFNELFKVYGSSLRGIIHEEFGDGIMSAIDCKIDVTKNEQSRVILRIDGKFLPYYKGQLD